MKKSNKIILIICAAVVIALGAWQFWLIFKAWQRTKEQLASLQIQYYKTAEELADSQKQIDSLNQKIIGFKKNNARLSQDKQSLQEKVASLTQEKQAIEAKLHSLKDLKQAIRQVKIEMHDQRVKQYLAREERQKAIDAQELALGNRGFMIKDAQSTYKPSIRIEVKPAQ